MALDRLKILLIIPDGSGRARLREVLANVVYKPELTSARTISEAVECLEHDPEVEVIFIAFSLGVTVVEEFLRRLNAEGIAKRHAVIITIDEQNSGYASRVVQLYQSGVDGFVAEPYSSIDVQTLLEKVRDPARVQKVQQAVRVFKSVQFLTKESLPHLDFLWKEQLAGRTPGGSALRALKALGPALEKLSLESPDEYLRAMSSVLNSLDPPVIPEGSRRRSAASEVPRHPGVIIREMMVSRQLSREKLLSIIRISGEDFDKILSGELGVNDTMARELARTLGRTAREWMAMQKRFDSVKTDHS